MRRLKAWFFKKLGDALLTYSDVGCMCSGTKTQTVEKYEEKLSGD